MDNIKLYKDDFNQNQLVSIVISDNKGTNSVPVDIIDYGVSGNIPITRLTNKRKIRSRNKVAPIGKIIPAYVETINGATILLSRLNIDHESSEYNRWEADKFTSKKLRSMIKFMGKEGIDMNVVLENIIYPLQDEWDKSITFFDYLKKNYPNIGLEESIALSLKKFMDKTNFVKKEIFRTKFALAATGSVYEMVEIIKPVIERYKSLEVLYGNYPYCCIVSDSFNSVIEDHSSLLNDLKSLQESSDDKKYQMKILET